jgi:molybdopterin converting factor small subunit
MNMKVPVHLYSNLQRYTADSSLVETEGHTVGECLTHLIQKYPDIGPVILDKSGRIPPHVYISINLESANSETIERQLSAGDQIYIILIVAGG